MAKFSNNPLLTSRSDELQDLAMAKFSNNPLLTSRSDELQENKTDDEDSLSSATLAKRYDKDVPVSAR